MKMHIACLLVAMAITPAARAYQFQIAGYGAQDVSGSVSFSNSLSAVPTNIAYGPANSPAEYFVSAGGLGGYASSEATFGNIAVFVNPSAVTASSVSAKASWSGSLVNNSAATELISLQVRGDWVGRPQFDDSATLTIGGHALALTPSDVNTTIFAAGALAPGDSLAVSLSAAASSATLNEAILSQLALYYDQGLDAAAAVPFAAPVPEPATTALMAVGLGVLGTIIRRRRRDGQAAIGAA